MILTISIFMLCGFHAARAQQGIVWVDDEPEQPVVWERVPGDYKAEPQNIGGLTVWQEMTMGIQYNDNIFAQDSGPVSDKIISVRPAIKIEKKYDAHRFELKAHAEEKYYFENEKERHADYALETSGVLNANSSLGFLYNLRHERKAIDRREAGDTALSVKPVQVDRSSFMAGVSYRFNRLRIRFLGGAERIGYENDLSRLSGAPIILKDKNRTVHSASLRTTYDLLGRRGKKPDHVLFAEARFARENYDHVPNALGLITAPMRNNDELGFLAGVETNYKGLMTGRIGAGYFMRDFENNSDIDRFDFDADLAFNFTPRTTFLISGGRSVEQDNSFLTGAVRTEGEVGLDYEFLHNLYGRAVAGYSHSDFVSSSREDEEYEGAVMLRYLHSRHLESRLRFEHARRDSNVAGGDYDQNILIYSLTGRL